MGFEWSLEAGAVGMRGRLVDRGVRERCGEAVGVVHVSGVSGVEMAYFRRADTRQVRVPEHAE